MTTNSSNPVDGDVQALIADCQAEIAEIEKMLALWGAVPYLKSQLKRQQVALAALTAEPVGWRDYQSDSGVRWKQGEIFYGLTPHRAPLYTTPPAQLLRTVQLPPFIHSWEGDDVISGRNKGIMDCAEALRQQGFEVKND